MELVEKFAPSNLPNLTPTDFVDLTKDDIQLLASVYPIMQPKLLIAKEGTVQPQSPATYKSLYSLLFSGHSFYISGTMHGKPSRVIDSDADIKMAEAISVSEFVAPEGAIFTETDVVSETVFEAEKPEAFKKEIAKTPIKRTRKSSKK